MFSLSSAFFGTQAWHHLRVCVSPGFLVMLTDISLCEFFPGLLHLILTVTPLKTFLTDLYLRPYPLLDSPLLVPIIPTTLKKRLSSTLRIRRFTIRETD